MEIKRCPKCGETKSINEFHKKRAYKDGHKYWCKSCNIKEVKKYYVNHCEEIKNKQKEYYKNNKEKIREYNKEWYKNNLEYHSQWREDNPEKVKKGYQTYYKNNLGKIKEANRKRHLIPKNKLSSRFSCLIRNSLRGNKNNKHWEDLVNFTLRDLIIHLERQFKKGMAWSNYGKWHIDHRRPVSSFNFESYSDKEFKKCWDLTNLQPLWASENLRKSDKMI